MKSVKLSYGQSETSKRQASLCPIRCVTPSTKVQVPVVDMSTKIAAAKEWLGDRWLLTEGKP